MKQTLALCTILLLALAAPSCRQDNSPLPSNFIGYENNPILVPGEPGSWDDLYVFNSCVVEENDTIYLFYNGGKKGGGGAIGFATSTDGYHFTKFKGNPILTRDKTGYCAYSVSQAHLIKEDSLWVMYFNSRELAGYNTGPYFGRATSKSLKGPWIKGEKPIITTGSRGEWDCDFINHPSVLKLDDDRYVMYYGGGDNLPSFTNFYNGLATSTDGINWKKYNDPATTQHPFAESDPVMMTGNPGDWDVDLVLCGMVIPLQDGFEMYYHGGATKAVKWEIGSLGYATSKDGILWEKYKNNPIYTVEDDPYYAKMAKKEAIIQSPCFLVKDSIRIMYFNYGACVNSAIGMAIAEIR